MPAYNVTGTVLYANSQRQAATIFNREEGRTILGLMVAQHALCDDSYNLGTAGSNDAALASSHPCLLDPKPYTPSFLLPYPRVRVALGTYRRRSRAWR